MALDVPCLRLFIYAYKMEGFNKLFSTKLTFGVMFFCVSHSWSFMVNVANIVSSYMILLFAIDRFNYSHIFHMSTFKPSFYAHPECLILLEENLCAYVTQLLQ